MIKGYGNITFWSFSPALNLLEEVGEWYKVLVNYVRGNVLFCCTSMLLREFVTHVFYFCADCQTNDAAVKEDELNLLVLGAGDPCTIVTTLADYRRRCEEDESLPPRLNVRISAISIYGHVCNCIALFRSMCAKIVSSRLHDKCYLSTRFSRSHRLWALEVSLNIFWRLS